MTLAYADIAGGRPGRGISPTAAPRGPRAPYRGSGPAGRITARGASRRRGNPWRWLRDQVGAAVYLSRYVDGEVSVTQYAAGPSAPAVHEWVDFRCSAHATAVGKSLLTQLDHDGRRDHLARHRMARLTSRTITSDKLLLSRLAAQPPTAPVLDLQEYAVGTVCAAVPVRAGSAVGCLALSLPTEQAHRLRRAVAGLGRNCAPVLLALAIRLTDGWSRASLGTG